MELDEQAMLGLLIESDAVRRGASGSVEIDGREWRLRPVSMAQVVRMQNIDYDVRFLQGRLKDAKSAGKAKRLNKRIRKAYARKAAHKILGRWLWWIPGALWWTAMRLYNESEKVSATINAMESVSESRNFYLANLGSSKQALALSMMQVGENYTQRKQREESAQAMLHEDASPKKAQGSK